MRVTVDDVRLYFDVEGHGLAAQGREMVARPALVLLHGGPGADHSLFKPEFSAMADAAQVIYLDQRFYDAGGLRPAPGLIRATAGGTACLRRGRARGVPAGTSAGVRAAARIPLGTPG